MSKATRTPKDYTTKFSDDYSKIDSAVGCAEAKQAVKIAQELESSASSFANANASGDDSINSLVAIARSISANLSTLATASNNYGTQVEPHYRTLKIQLTALKSTEKSYKKKCANGPNKDNYEKTNINSDGEQYYTYPGYKDDLDDWNKKLDKYEKKLDSMTDNINSIKSQLKSAGEADIADVAVNGFNLSIPDIIPFTDDNYLRPDYDLILEEPSVMIHEKRITIGDHVYEVKYDDGVPCVLVDGKHVTIDGKKVGVGDFIPIEQKGIQGLIVSSLDGEIHMIYNQGQIEGWGGNCNRASGASICSGLTDDASDPIKNANDTGDGIGYDQNQTSKYFAKFGLKADVTTLKDRTYKCGEFKDKMVQDLQDGKQVMLHFKGSQLKGASGQQWTSKNAGIHWVAAIDRKVVDGKEYVFISDPAGNKDYRAGSTKDHYGVGAGWYSVDEFDDLPIDYYTVVGKD